MKKTIIRIIILLSAVLLQVSFVNILTPSNYNLNIVLLLTVAWIFIVDFEKIWLWILILGILTDIVNGNMAINIFYFLTLIYLVSFISKRILIDRYMYKLFLAIFIISVFFLTNMVVDMFASGKFNIGLFLEQIKSKIFLTIYFKNILINAVGFCLVYYVLNKIENETTKSRKMNYDL